MGRVSLPRIAGCLIHPRISHTIDHPIGELFFFFLTNELFNDDKLCVGITSRRRVTFFLVLIAGLFNDAKLIADIPGVEGCC